MPDLGPILCMRAAIAAKLRDHLGASDGGAVEEHPRAGFGEADLNAALKNRALALRVAFAGIPVDAQWSGHEVDAATAWVIYMAAKDLRGPHEQERDVVVLSALPEVLSIVANGNWRVPDDVCVRDRAEGLRVGPLYEGDIDGKSAAVWSVSWRMTISFPPCDTGDVRNFLKLTTRYDLAPKDEVLEAEDEIILESP